MKILSWDIGIVNSAYCLFEVEDKQFKVLKWGLINLVDDSICSQCKKKGVHTKDNVTYCQTHKPTGGKKIPTATKIDIEELCYKLILELDKLELLDCDEVIIENQPCMKNPKMKSISSCVFNYYLIRGKVDKQRVKSVSFISATNKLKVPVEIELKQSECSSKYQYRKKASKMICEKMIKDNKDYLEMYNSHKKKDDLADCFLQGVYYINKTVKNCQFS